MSQLVKLASQFWEKAERITFLTNAETSSVVLDCPLAKTADVSLSEQLNYYINYPNILWDCLIG